MKDIGFLHLSQGTIFINCQALTGLDGHLEKSYPIKQLPKQNQPSTLKTLMGPIPPGPESSAGATFDASFLRVELKCHIYVLILSAMINISRQISTIQTSAHLATKALIVSH